MVGYAVILFSAIHLTDGGDYVTGPFIVNFTAGQMTATLMVSTVDDIITELSEYFSVVITSTDQPGTVEIGIPGMSFITIEDNEPGNVQIVNCICILVHLLCVSVLASSLCRSGGVL